MRHWITGFVAAIGILCIQGDAAMLPQDMPGQHAWYPALARMVADGDIIFRRGSSMASRVVLMSDPDSDYSHTGIVHIRDSVIRVVHAAPGEYHNDSAAVKSESLATFTKPALASKVGLVRVKSAHKTSSELASRTAYGYYCRNVLFDKAYDLQDTAALYCTELIWQAYLHAGVDLVNSHFDKLNALVKTADFILPSSLFYSPYIEIVAEFP